MRAALAKGALKPMRQKFVIPDGGVDGYGDGFGGDYTDACATENLWRPLVERAIQEAAWRAKGCRGPGRLRML